MRDLFRYDGKRALVVGCASGMGAATAQILASLGAEVHGVDYMEPDFDLAGFTRCDLREPAQIESMIAGHNGPVHSLFYCAGLPPTSPPLEVMKVNFAAMRAVVEGMQSSVARGGSIAIIASTGGLHFMERMPQIMELLGTDGFDGAMSWCEAHEDVVADGYVFSKEAITVYTMKRALQVVESGVRVNCISPSATATPMMPKFEEASSPETIALFLGPMDRKAEPEEMGWPLAFLNSEAAGFITGLNLVVDGGFLAGVMTGAIDVDSLIAKAMATQATKS